MAALAVVGALIVRPLCSGLAHLLNGLSRRAFVFWWSVDYVSICAAVLCASIPLGRFTFYCDEDKQLFFYVSCGGLFASTVLAVVYVAESSVRTFAFLIFVVFANWLPMLFFVYDKAVVKDPDAGIGWAYVRLWCAAMGTMTAGLLIKALQLPDALLPPGACDILFHSHQWWHLSSTAGSCSCTF